MSWEKQPCADNGRLFVPYQMQQNTVLNTNACLEENEWKCKCRA